MGASFGLVKDSLLGPGEYFAGGLLFRITVIDFTRS